MEWVREGELDALEALDVVFGGIGGGGEGEEEEEWK